MSSSASSSNAHIQSHAAQEQYGSYESSGMVEDEMRALEAQLLASQDPATGRKGENETWLNSSDEEKRKPLSATTATSAHKEALQQRSGGSMLSSPASEDSRYSSATHSGGPRPSGSQYDMSGAEDSSFEAHEISAHGRTGQTAHHHHRRIHVVDIPTSSSESSLADMASGLSEPSRASSPAHSSEQSFGNVSSFPYGRLIRHKREAADLDRDVFGGDAHDSALDGPDADADNEGTPSPHVLEGRRYKMWARKERTSVASSSGSGGTAHPPSGFEDSPITPGRYRGGHARGTSGGRLAFVAPADLSSRSLEDLQRRLSATDEQEGTSKSGQSSTRQDGNASAPAYRTTFRVEERPQRRLSDDTAADVKASGGDVSPKLVTPKARQEAELKKTITSPVQAGAAMATTPRQAEQNRVEVTPRGPQSNEKFRTMGSPTENIAGSPRPRLELAEERTMPNLPAARLMGLGFGEDVSPPRTRGVSPDPPPRSGLRRKSARMENFAEYLEAGSGSASEGGGASPRSSLSIEGIPGTEPKLKPVASAYGDLDSAEPSVPPQRISSRNANVSTGALSSYNTSSSLSSSDMGSPPIASAPAPARFPLAGMYQQRGFRDSVASLALENIATNKTASPATNRISFSSMRRPASLLSMRSTNSSLLKLPQKQPSFSVAQSRPWPAAMVIGHVKSIKNPGDRAREYAKATNALLQTDSGMSEWYTMAKARCGFHLRFLRIQSQLICCLFVATPPVHGSRARQRSKLSAAQSLGIGLAPGVGSQHRDVSGQSIRSDASFPTRLDATVATEIDFREVDPLDPPDALPPLPYPQAQLTASHSTMKNSASTQSVKSLGNALSGGFFAALGRRGSSKHPKADMSPRRIGFPVAQDGGSPSSAMKRSLDLGGPRQTSVPAPMGPRERTGQQSLDDARASLDSRMPLSETSHPQQYADQIKKQSAPANTHASQDGGYPSDDVERMMEVLPHADPMMLADYLQRHGEQMTAIG